MADLMTLLNSARINRTYLMCKDIGGGCGLKHALTEWPY